MRGPDSEGAAELWGCPGRGCSCGKVDYIVPGGEVGGCFSTVRIGVDLSMSDKSASEVVVLIQYERRHHSIGVCWRVVVRGTGWHVFPR